MGPAEMRAFEMMGGGALLILSLDRIFAFLKWWGGQKSSNPSCEEKVDKVAQEATRIRQILEDRDRRSS